MSSERVQEMEGMRELGGRHSATSEACLRVGITWDKDLLGRSSGGRDRAVQVG